MKRIIKVFLLICSLIAVERLCHLATDGFAMVNIYAPKGDNKKWTREGNFPQELFDKPFTYFDSGSQSYVFLSDDGETILKLFKFQHMRTPPWLDFLPLNGALGEKREKKRAILERTFNSFVLAYDTMQEETGLIYLHLTKTHHLNKTATLVDKIGKKHTLDLDNVEFVLQKRGMLAYDAIEKWMREGEEAIAKEGISSLLRLAASRCHKGIFDKDPDFRTNFGFIEAKPFQIDFGRLTLNEDEKDPKIYGPEMIRITRHFENWIEKNHPSLLDSFQKELNAIVSD